jgi:hypothetical protein
MDRIDLPSFGGQLERPRADVKKRRCLTEVEPRLNSLCSRTINRDLIVGSQRRNALTRPAITIAGRQLVPIENARNEIVVRNEHQLADGIDDIVRRGIALAAALLNSLGGVAIDGEGNMWTGDNFLVGSQSTIYRGFGGGISKIAPNGRPISPNAMCVGGPSCTGWLRWVYRAAPSHGKTSPFDYDEHRNA